MGPPELAGLAAVPESDVAAAKDAPAGWSRDLTLPLRKPGGGPLVGDNGQARRRLFVAECARACAGARRADKGASMGREAGPGSRGCVQADGGDSVVRIDGRVLRALARARRSRLFPIDRRVLSCAPRARAHVQEPRTARSSRPWTAATIPAGEGLRAALVLLYVGSAHPQAARMQPCARQRARLRAEARATHNRTHMHTAARPAACARKQTPARIQARARARAARAAPTTSRRRPPRSAAPWSRPSGAPRTRPARPRRPSRACSGSRRAPPRPRRACRNRPAFPPAGGVRPTARLASLACPCESMSVCVWASSACFAQCICAFPVPAPVSHRFHTSLALVSRRARLHPFFFSYMPWPYLPLTQPISLPSRHSPTLVFDSIQPFGASDSFQSSLTWSLCRPAGSCYRTPLPSSFRSRS